MSKMKCRKLLSILCYVIIISGCFSSSYLHPSDVLGKMIQTEYTEGQYCICIKGLCVHSAMGIEKVEISISNATMSIRFPLKLSGNGNIDEYIKIPVGVTNVLWEGVSVWNLKE